MLQPCGFLAEPGPAAADRIDIASDARGASGFALAEFNIWAGGQISRHGTNGASSMTTDGSSLSMGSCCRQARCRPSSPRCRASTKRSRTRTSHRYGSPFTTSAAYIRSRRVPSTSSPLRETYAIPKRYPAGLSSPRPHCRLGQRRSRAPDRFAVHLSFGHASA